MSSPAPARGPVSLMQLEFDEEDDEGKEEPAEVPREQTHAEENELVRSGRAPPTSAENPAPQDPDWDAGQNPAFTLKLCGWNADRGKNCCLLSKQQRRKLLKLDKVWRNRRSAEAPDPETRRNTKSTHFPGTESDGAF